MNIFTKIKNWLIHLLGGYTEEEYAYVMDKWVETLKLDEKLYKIEENRLRIAESNVEYWCDKYTTEHENYLAMLNCHNAAASATQNGTAGVAGAIDTIMAYCNGKDGCDNCALYDANKGCKVAMCPCYWGE